MAIEQALISSAGPGDHEFLAQSPGFRANWRAEAERLCEGFGNGSADHACPLALFARPFARNNVAVVQVADRGRDQPGRVGVLAFRLLIVSRTDYADLGGDPFWIADVFPPDWSAHGEVPTLVWPAARPADRTLAQTQKILKLPNSATLFGGAQALLDGGRLAFERTEPDAQLVRNLWDLLPYSTRAELWPTTYAFANAHGFHVVVVPRADGPTFENYIFEEQAGDYPEGHYELALRTAVDAGDEREMQRLFFRRSRRQTMRLGFALLAILVFGPLLASYLAPVEKAKPRQGLPAAPTTKKDTSIPAPERTKNP